MKLNKCFISSVIFFVFTAMLSACGDDSDDLQISPDLTATTLVSVTPSTEGGPHPASNVISVTFDENLDCSTVTTSSFQLFEKGNAVDGYT